MGRRRRSGAAPRLASKPLGAGSAGVSGRGGGRGFLASAGILRMQPALFDDSDGTSKREALRQWFMGTVKPLARLVEHELSDKLDTDVKLRFDNYPLDLAGRAQAFQNSWRAAWRLMRR